MKELTAPGHILSILEICPAELTPHIHDLCGSMSKMLRMTESSVRKKVKPTELFDRIRLSFWIEVNKSLVSRRRIKLNAIIRGCCSSRVFMQILKNERRFLLWILTPPKDYVLAMRQILKQSTAEILKLVSGECLAAQNLGPSLKSLNVTLRILESKALFECRFDAINKHAMDETIIPRLA